MRTLERTDNRVPRFPAASLNNALARAAATLLTAGDRWRRLLAEAVDPKAHDLVIDLHCGDGATALMLSELSPRSEIIAADADAATLNRARALAQREKAAISFVRGQPGELPALIGRQPASKLVISRLAGMDEDPFPVEDLRAARALLKSGGVIHVAEFCAPFSADSAAPAGALRGRFREAGFVAVDHAPLWTSPLGAVHAYRARAN